MSKPVIYVYVLSWLFYNGKIENKENKILERAMSRFMPHRIRCFRMISFNEMFQVKWNTDKYTTSLQSRAFALFLDQLFLHLSSLAIFSHALSLCSLSICFSLPSLGNKFSLSLSLFQSHAHTPAS